MHLDALCFVIRYQIFEFSRGSNVTQLTLTNCVAVMERANSISYVKKTLYDVFLNFAKNLSLLCDPTIHCYDHFDLVLFKLHVVFLHFASTMSVASNSFLSHG